MRSSLLFCVVALAHPAAAHAITLGQVDDFQDGGLAHWRAMYNPPVTNTEAGGGGGAGDRYLRVASSGSAETELGVWNNVQWYGDFLTPGVTVLEMDLCNFGNAPLEMRVWLSGNGGTFTSTTANIIPADGAWHHALFGLTSADLTSVGGGAADLAGTLRQNRILGIRHQSGPPLNVDQGGGTPVASELGIDNIGALPEPSAACLSLLAMMQFVAIRRRSRQRQ